MLKIKHKTTQLESQEEHSFWLHEVKEIFVGYRTIFSLLGFTVGGLLVARSLWAYLSVEIGLLPTALIGLVIFTISGLLLGQFRK